MPLYNIKYSVIEKGDKTREANDSERLSTYSAEDYACESGGKESFVDAVETACAAVHVYYECEGGKETWWESAPVSELHVGEMLEGELYEIDSDGASKCSIRPCIRDIALVLRQTSLNIVIHVPPRPENSVTPPASLVVKVVGIIFYCLHFGSIK